MEIPEKESMLNNYQDINSLNNAKARVFFPVHQSNLNLFFNCCPCVQATELPMNLSFDWTLVNLISFNEAKLKLYAQITLIWYDSFRAWDYFEVPIFYLSLPASEVWTPRFSFLNADEVKYAELSARSGDRVNLLQNGTAYIVLTRVLEGKCDVNLRNFPFDQQTCELVFLLDRFYLGVGPMNILISRSTFSYQSKIMPNAEWDVISTISEAQNSSLNTYAYNNMGNLLPNPTFVLENFFVGYKVIITLKRHWIYYLLNILIPIFVLSALTFAPFTLDEKEPEKIATGIAVILGFMFIQGIVADLLPKSHLSPYLADYIASVILLSALSVIANLICYAITLVHHNKPQSPGPLVRFVVLKALGFLLYPAEWLKVARRCHEKIKGKIKVDVADRASIWQLADSSASIVTTTEIQVKPISESGSLERNDEQKLSTLRAPNERVNLKEWHHVAHILNRFFALLHLIGSIILFSVFLIPIMIS